MVLFNRIPSSFHACSESAVVFVATARIIIGLFPFPLLASLVFAIALTRPSHAPKQGSAGATNECTSAGTFFTAGNAADNCPGSPAGYACFTGTPYFLLSGRRR